MAGTRLGLIIGMSARRNGLLFSAPVVAFLVFLSLVASPAAAQSLRGVALVIGNGEYEHLSALPNPGNDARAVEELLSDLGFDTDLSSDRDGRRLARDLESFAKDAEGADVAILYYSGHGIEAGGENFLVPVDADLSALDAAGEKLVSISALIERLQATVPVTILMLDACRDNPFPPGATVRLAADAAPVPMGAGGLGETRGAKRIGSASRPVRDAETVGTVIAFAAEPGMVALDGAPGGNSPYTAAVLRHFGAMAGEEFGTVMRMVAEEVYLKTDGRQRPWVNESLRRLLYFGETVDARDGPEGDILRERRQLLVTIADLPDIERRQVEAVARRSSVPMDAVYAMLRKLGADTPQDPAELEKVLRREAERFADILAERETINSPDPEVVRLSRLADEAEREGLISSADSFRERAKARYLETETTLESQEAALRQRFVEGAAVFARSAETKALAFDHLAAARDYAEAFRRVDGRDARLAWRYRHAEMEALADHGNYKGDNAALERAIELGGEVLGLAERLDGRADWAQTMNDLGKAYQIVGDRRGDDAMLTKAAEAFRAALDEPARKASPAEWALTQSNLGVTLQALGELRADVALLGEAVAAARAAADMLDRRSHPLDWGTATYNLAFALESLGLRQQEPETLAHAVDAYRESLTVLTHEKAPVEWATANNGLANALSALGGRVGDPALFVEAAAGYEAALTEFTRERAPLDWAKAQANIGILLSRIGSSEQDHDKLERAVIAFEAAAQELTRGRDPVGWASIQTNRGATLAVLGERMRDVDRLRRAVDAYALAATVQTRDVAPMQWATINQRVGSVLVTLGLVSEDLGVLDDAVATFEQALQVFTPQGAPRQWAGTQDAMGGILVEIGAITANRDRIVRGREAIAAAWDLYRSAGQTQNDGYFQRRLANADAALAALP